MKKTIFATIALFAALQLSGCVLFHGYAPPVQQGNVISAAKVNQLHTGMSKAEVLRLMGAPIYTTTFSTNRWDYVYTYQVEFRRIHEKRVIVSFRDGVVSGIQKDLSPIKKA